MSQRGKKCPTISHDIFTIALVEPAPLHAQNEYIVRGTSSLWPNGRHGRRLRGTVKWVLPEGCSSVVLRRGLQAGGCRWVSCSHGARSCARLCWRAAALARRRVACVLTSEARLRVRPAPARLTGQRPRTRPRYPRQTARGTRFPAKRIRIERGAGRIGTGSAETRKARAAIEMALVANAPGNAHGTAIDGDGTDPEIGETTAEAIATTATETEAGDTIGITVAGIGGLTAAHGMLSKSPRGA